MLPFLAITSKYDWIVNKNLLVSPKIWPWLEQSILICRQVLLTILTNLFCSWTWSAFTKKLAKTCHRIGDVLEVAWENYFLDFFQS